VKRTWLVSLTEETCWSLVGSAKVGRLGVVIDGRPLVFPICHVFTDGCVFFPTNEGSKMHGALSWPWVGCEVDGVEDDQLSAWSVMIGGSAEVVAEPGRIAELEALQSFTFRHAGPLRWIRIVPETVTGRRIASD